MKCSANAINGSMFDLGFTACYSVVRTFCLEEYEMRKINFIVAVFCFFSMSAFGSPTFVTCNGHSYRVHQTECCGPSYKDYIIVDGARWVLDYPDDGTIVAYSLTQNMYCTAN